MNLNLPTISTCAIVITGSVVAAPVLMKGFKRRGTGIKYERKFAIQRAPQLLILLNVVLIAVAFLAYIGLMPNVFGALMVLGNGDPTGLAKWISWLGVLILVSGMFFMIGGWYSLGEYFSTDAEVLQGQGVCRSGFFKYVMHPIYSGIIQCLLGASLAATSLLSAAVALFVVAPLWINRAKYEEGLLLEHLGPDYKRYGEEMHWRRLVPTIFPFGV